MLPDLQLNDHLRLRKPHPCGGYDWRVLRLGADLKIECLTCGRQVMLTRRELARRTKVVLPQHTSDPSSSRDDFSRSKSG